MANRVLSFVAALAEVCSRDNLVPEYDLLKVEGPCHDPVFVIRGHVGQFQADGRGAKKQTAKQHAAKQILLQMGELNLEDLKIVESTAHWESAKVIGNVVDDFTSPYRSSIPIEDNKDRKRNFPTPIPVANQINPLGDLIEMSLIMGWPHPRVVDEQKTGPAHDPRFTVSCYFAKFKTFATSRSKKEAKRLAALEMHGNMRYQPEIMYKYSLRTGRPLDISAVCTDVINEPMDFGAFATSGDFCFGGVTKILEISQSHTVDMLKQLKSVDEIANPETVLGNILKECQFQMCFEELCEDLQCRVMEPENDSHEQNGDGVNHPLKMSFSVLPVIDDSDDELNEPVPRRTAVIRPKDLYSVFCVLRLPIRTPIRLLGYGQNREDARYSAARNMLQYIQLMSLKSA